MPAPPSTVTAERRAEPAAAARDFAQSGAVAEPPDEKLGTGHGAREWSVSETVSFHRATPWPQFIRRIEYDTYANLAASGVIPYAYEERRPRPFPAHPDGEDYVPDPPDDP